MSFPDFRSGVWFASPLLLLSELRPQVFAAGTPAFEMFSLTFVVLILFLAALGGGAIYYLRFIRSDSEVNEQNKPDTVPLPEREPRRASVSGYPKDREKPASKAASAAGLSKVYNADADILDLPISRFTGLEMPAPIDELEESSDPDLLDAIEQIADDSESDPEVRLIALKVIARFRCRNAVDVLAEVARFDLSTMLRSKAVTILADFDHPSVFAPIVIACADPTKEVRSTAARALVKLSFDRSESWARIALSDDEYLIRQVARAAVEAGLAEKSFDRLAMHDPKAAYEAFALAFLLLKAGETRTIFDAIRNHRDLRTRLALIHTIKVANVPEVIPELCEFIAAEPMSSRLADRAREALLNINNVPATRG